MTADMAVELKKHNVACVTLYPGPVVTEIIQAVRKTEEGVSILGHTLQYQKSCYAFGKSTKI